MKIVNAKVKDKILKESYEKGCVITELGKKYGISEKTIYGWRRRNKDYGEDKIQGNLEKFIEVPIKVEARDSGKSRLKKAELVYERFRIEINGEISSTKVAEIIQILEGE